MTAGSKVVEKVVWKADLLAVWWVVYSVGAMVAAKAARWVGGMAVYWVALSAARSAKTMVDWMSAVWAVLKVVQLAA